MSLISIVVPCFNEEETIPIFYEEIKKIEKEMEAEIEFYFIDDGSSDATLYILRELRKKDLRVHYISFSRNFGKEAALLAGMEASTGDFIVTMDVDLQDPPSLLPEMWRTLCFGNNEYDCVATRRSTRKGEPLLRSYLSKLFYKIINWMSLTEIVDGARDYRFMSRKMANAIINDKEYNRFSKGLYSWVGFKTRWIEYENIERSAGKTKWSFSALVKYSVEGILAYSTIPLSLASIMGIFFCMVSFLVMIFIVVRAALYGDPVAGWPSMVSIITFLDGIILLFLGIIGLYLFKI